MEAELNRVPRMKVALVALIGIIAALIVALMPFDWLASLNALLGG